MPPLIRISYDPYEITLQLDLGVKPGSVNLSQISALVVFNISIESKTDIWPIPPKT